MSRSFVKHYAVRFGEIDHAGVMYYPALFHRMHQGFEDFWNEAAQCNYAEILSGHNVGFPLVHIDCSFSKPFRFGENLRLEIDIARLGNRSVSFRFRLGQGEDPEVRAEATMVLGVIDFEKFAARELPPELRHLLDPYVFSAEGAQG